MKKILLALVVVLLLVVSCSRTKRERYRDGRTKIETTDGLYQYKFSARFPDDKTDRVRFYLKQKLAEPGLLDEKRFSDEVALRSQVKIKLRLRPGYVEMRLKKDERLESEIDQVRDMGEALKKIITQKETKDPQD